MPDNITIPNLRGTNNQTNKWGFLGSTSQMNLPDVPSWVSFGGLLENNLRTGFKGLKSPSAFKFEIPKFNTSNIKSGGWGETPEQAEASLNAWKLGGGKQGISETAAKGPSKFGIGNYIGAGMSLATGIADIDGIANSNMNKVQKKMAYGDSAVNTIGDVAQNFGPIGQAVGAGLKIVNSIGGSLLGTPKVLKDFTVNDTVGTSSAFTGVAAGANDMSNSAQSYQKSGLAGKLLAGSGKMKSAANQSNSLQTQVAGLIDNNTLAKNRAFASGNMFASNNLRKLYGGNQFLNGAITYGQAGMKMQSKDYISPVDGYKTQQSNLDAYKKAGLEFSDQKALGQWYDSWAKPAPKYDTSVKISYGPLAQRQKNQMTGEEWDFMKRQMNFPTPLNIPGRDQNYYNNYGLDINNPTTPYHSNIMTNLDKFNSLLGKYRANKAPIIMDTPIDKPGSTLTTRLQEGGLIFKPNKRPEVESIATPDLDVSTRINISTQKLKLAELAKQRQALQEENDRFKKSIQEQEIPLVPVAEAEPEKKNINKFQDFENASLTLLQGMNPGKNVAIKYENQGVYAPDGSRDWATQADLKKSGASKTGLSLHNFGAAKDYRIVIDGKTVDPSNTKLYKDVLWAAAKQTGLHTLGEWDVAHIGLAPEGTGETWNHLAKNHPDIFESERAKDTIEKLKKAGQTKYLAQLERPLSSINYNKNGGVISNKNVIVHGALHAHKHSLKEVEELAEAAITLKGIPVITKDAEGGVLQHSEVEGGEVVLHYELTQKLEDLRKDGSEEALIKAGKLLARELMKNTKDKTGTLRSIKNINND